MPRDIKFRVWNLKDKEWDNPAILEVWDKSGTFRTMYSPENYVIQQYTGLKDRNNKEIYEGDIVSCYSWFDGTGNKPKNKTNILVELQFKTTISNETCGGYEGEQIYEDIEIVGNIFENPA